VAVQLANRTIPDLKLNQKPISQSAIQYPESFRDALKQSLRRVGKYFKEPAQIGRGFRQLLFGEQFPIGINGNKSHITTMQIDFYVNHDVLPSLCYWGITNPGGDVFFGKIKYFPECSGQALRTCKRFLLDLRVGRPSEETPSRYLPTLL
jgi:hypothetical protein